MPEAQALNAELPPSDTPLTDAAIADPANGFESSRIHIAAVYEIERKASQCRALTDAQIAEVMRLHQAALEAWNEWDCMPDIAGADLDDPANYARASKYKDDMNAAHAALESYLRSLNAGEPRE